MWHLPLTARHFESSKTQAVEWTLAFDKLFGQARVMCAVEIAPGGVPKAPGVVVNACSSTKRGNFVNTGRMTTTEGEDRPWCVFANGVAANEPIFHPVSML